MQIQLPISIAETASASRAQGPIVVERWPSETRRFAVALVVSLLLWVAAVVSIVGILYGALLGVFFFVTHLAFVAHIRGSGVRLGPDQLPELHARVSTLARRMGMETVPEAYLMQAGGALNAFATRFLGANLVVLYSDLLDACGDNEAARDMIIAHELGHVHAGHLRWHWLLLPSHLVPFLGSALSRAREYTCDRYGLAGAGDLDGALHGLTILAAGATHAPRVNRRALVRQRADIDTGWMTIGQWLGGHPPLARRLLALDPSLATPGDAGRGGRLRAAAILAVVVLGGGTAFGYAVSRVGSLMEQAAPAAAEGAYVAPYDAAELVPARFDRIADYLEAEQAAGRALPLDAEELYDRWTAAHPGQEEPIDPFDGAHLGYELRGQSYVLWSSGPDQAPDTADDLVFSPPAP